MHNAYHKFGTTFRNEMLKEIFATSVTTNNQTYARVLVPVSVTRLLDILDFGQLFKAFGSN